MAEITPPPDDLDQLKRALAALKKARSRIEALEQARSEPIAIIGIGCRLPGDLNTPEAFWQLLKEGRSAIRAVPSDRWDREAYLSTSPDEPGKMQSPFGGFLSNIDQFDPHFFGISPREANAMDPQQRLALEVAWEALEDAGIVPADLAGSGTGVFIGIGLNDYARLQAPAQTFDPTLMDNYFIQGNALCITANRISYALDLRGPSMAIDTACSSSLVSIHAACQSLRSGESSLALAGGSNVILSPANSIGLSKFLAPDGQCKTFDARADGYTRGEGSIILVLRRLSEAVASGDRIYAVIRGSATNQDGFSSGLTVPNGAAQEAMLRTALKNAGVEPAEVEYVEAHGTGTSLGDPIEANALGAVFAPGRGSDQKLLIGSVKTNIGHLEAGAGIAGVLKTALALYYGEIPPSLNYDQPNPLIDFDALRLQVVTQPTPWPRRNPTPRAGISSFGFGGANAHVILEAAPAANNLPQEAAQNPPYLFTLSARTSQALSDSARRFAEFFEKNPSLSPAYVCSAVHRRRSHFAHRLAVTQMDLAGLREELNAYASGQPTPNLVSGQVGRTQPRVAFLFTGQGSQYVGMGRQLYETQPVFRDALDRCSEILLPVLGEPLLDVLYPGNSQPITTRAPSKIDNTTYTQPALFAIEYALAELWKSWGVEPAMVMGHSVGEFAAAVVAGAMSLEDGLKLIAARGRLMGSLPAGGGMAAVFAPLETVEAAVKDHNSSIASQQAVPSSSVSIAAINGPDGIVISGAEAELHAVLDKLQVQGIKSKKLTVSHAFHSALMDPILDDFEAVAKTCQFTAPGIGLVSNISGKAFSAGETLSAAYWRQHVRAPVNFNAGMQTLHEQGIDLFLEIGPQPVLIGMGKRCLPEETGTWLPSLRMGQAELPHMLKSLGMLYCSGLEVRWTALDGEAAQPVISLPAYPFQRERYWFKEHPQTGYRKPIATGTHPLVGSRLHSPAIQGKVFETVLSPETLGYLWDHRAYGTAIFPATGYIEMALTSAAQALGGSFCLEEITIQEALILPEEGEVSLQVVITPAAEAAAAVQIYTNRKDSEDWQLHFATQLRQAQTAAAPTSLEEAKAACPTEMAQTEFYAQHDQRGMQYGQAFQNIHQLWTGDGQVLARVQLPASLPTAGYTIHPALLDACLQIVGVLQPAGASETFLPLGFDQVNLTAEPGSELWSYAVRRPDRQAQEHTGSESFTSDLTLFDSNGQVVCQVTGMRLVRSSRSALQRLVQREAGHLKFADWIYRMEWQQQALPQAALPPALPARSLVLAESEIGAALAEMIDQAVLAVPGETLVQTSTGHWTFNPSRPEELKQLLDQANASQVVCLSGSLRTALYLLQEVTKSAAPPNVWLATLGAQPVLGDRSGSDDVDVEPAALWGLARSVRLEYPDLHLHCIDLDPAALAGHNAQSLWAEVQAQSSEDEVAYRNDERYVSRLVHTPAVPTELKPVRLTIPAPGIIDDLRLEPLDRRLLQKGEVEINVRATGINFRDVLITLGMYPEDVQVLGNECAGTVTAVGEGVTNVNPGDNVLALASDCFATYAIARSEFVMRKPPEMSFEHAATIPIAFLTADYALNTLGKLQTGEKVLIHAAAGGVGLAAVQLAQLAGAEIFATAGSPEKRLLLHNLGVEHVMDSRSLGFADEIIRLTNGEGVDLVLNSLADDFIPQSLRILRPGGRFLEIGKRGIWTHEQVAALGKAIDYHIIFLGGLFDQQSALISELFENLMQKFASGALRPLPYRSFPLTRAADAFRFMAQAKHVGKIVLTQPPLKPEPVKLQPNATYLVTGGLGGLGLAIARRLVEAGAQHLVLVGRSLPSEAAQSAIRQMSERAEVVPLQADIAQVGEVQRALDLIQQRYPPLRGIVHAAGVLDDGILAQQDWTRYTRVLGPKLEAAWHLHRLTLHIPLDFFLLFSAGAGWLGTAGQSGYTAANTAVDALASYRQGRGLPGMSIAWGPWAEVGMAARLNTLDQERLTRQGLGMIEPEEGLLIFESLLGQGGAFAVLPMDWSRYAAEHAHIPPRFSDLARRAQAAVSVEKTDQSARSDLRKRLAEAAPNRRKPLLQAHVREQVIRVLGLSAAYPLDTHQPLREVGMDSLMAVELRNAFATSLQHKLPSSLLFDYPTVDALSDFLLHELWQEAPQSAEPAPAAPASTASEVENISDEEAEALLLAELDALKSDKKRS